MPATILESDLAVRQTLALTSFSITETRPFKNVDRENANKWKMTLI